MRRRDKCEIAYAFHAGVAGGLVDAALVLCDEYRLDTSCCLAMYFRTSCCWSTQENDCCAPVCGCGPITRCRRTTAVSASVRRRWPRVPPRPGGYSFKLCM